MRKEKKLLNKIRAQEGFTLIDVLVAMGISAVMIVIIMGVVWQASARRIERNRVTTMLYLREHIFSILNRYINFQDTVHYAGNPTFSCVIAHASCAGQPTNGNFTLILRNNITALGSVFAYYNPATDGFDDDGAKCPSGSNPTKACPIKINFDWAPICTTCNPAVISVTVKFSTYDRNLKRIRPSGFNFTMLKSVYNANYFPLTPPYPP